MPLPVDLLNNTLIAGAIGDCCGVPFEGSAAGQHRRLPEPPWFHSDDTEFTLATCSALGPATCPEDVAASMLEAYRNGVSGCGAATLGAMQQLAVGQHWALCGRIGEFAAGNGAAMRIAPLAFVADPMTRAGRSLIRDVARITHRNDEASTAALAVVVAMNVFGSRREPTKAMRAVAAELPSTAVRDQLLKLAGRGPKNMDPPTGHAPDSVPFALWIAASNPTLESAVVASVRAGGDTDTVASIAGQVLGACGVSIPRHLQCQVAACSRIAALAEQAANRISNRGG